GKTSRELHGIYDSTISYRTFFRKLKELESAKLIHLEERNTGEGKRSNVYFGSLKRLEEF
ncbi:MAG: hypothetical protein AABY07_11285, partial [Nanoarchaeota archaeon]